MSFRIALVLSLALHLAVYALAELAVPVAPPRPPPRAPIEAMLIVPEIPVPQEAAPAPATAPVAAPQAPGAAPRVPKPQAGPLPAPGTTQAALAPRRPEPPPNYYPPEAVLRGIEGEALVQLALDPSGRILSAQLARSSGHAILDEAALRAVRSLKTVPGGGREAMLPVRFRLR